MVQKYSWSTLNIRIRKRNQTTNAVGLMMLFSIKGQKSIPTNSSNTATRNDTTTHLEIFISARFPRLTAV